MIEQHRDKNINKIPSNIYVLKIIKILSSGTVHRERIIYVKTI